MSNQTYLQLVADIRHICSSLSLQLPTHTAAIASQRRAIDSVHQKLEAIEPKVRAIASRSWRPTHRSKYQTLDHLLCKLLTEAFSMTLLADEFMADPEGSVSCLRSVNQRKDQLVHQLSELENLCRNGSSLKEFKLKVAQSLPSSPIHKRRSDLQKRSPN
ncbi:MAG: hypothetical protein AAGD25_05245 [Cyanobacteria bacterium P01_F01_bin.150]